MQPPREFLGRLLSKRLTPSSHCTQKGVYARVEQGRLQLGRPSGVSVWPCPPGELCARVECPNSQCDLPCRNGPFKSGLRRQPDAMPNSIRPVAGAAAFTACTAPSGAGVSNTSAANANSGSVRRPKRASISWPPEIAAAPPQLDQRCTRSDAVSRLCRGDSFFLDSWLLGAYFSLRIID